MSGDAEKCLLTTYFESVVWCFPELFTKSHVFINSHVYSCDVSSRTSNRYESGLSLINPNRQIEALRDYSFMMIIYKKSFIFEATSFEEFQDGKCVSKGPCSITVIAKVLNDERIGMLIQGKIPVQINPKFGLPILGVQSGDVLDDRVQYGRIPDSMSWPDSNEPIVCNIFYNINCISFAMMWPLRIVEFYGQFTDVRDL